MRFSSTDSTVEVEAKFDHNLKKRKRKKKRTNLSLNQSRRKKKKISYGQQVRIKKIPNEVDNLGGECSHSLQFSVSNQEKELDLLAPAIQPSESSSETVDVDVESQISDEVELNPFLQDCINKCKDIFLEDVIKNFDKEGLLLHFMAFMEMIPSGQLSVVNMAVLLAMEMALLFSLASTTQIRYRNDTCLFWETVLAVGGPRMLRLFSSDKHFGQVNSGQSSKSRYEPHKGNFNFTVPDEKVLRKSKTGLPNVIGCGIIEDSVKLLDKDKEFVLSLDGKQLIPGLINDTEGDINL